MKTLLKTILLTLFVCTKCSMFGQQSGNVMTKLVKAKNISILHEDDRIRLVTKAGQRMVGYFKIIDNNTIDMNGQKILLSDIESFRRRSILSTVLEPISFTIAGIYTAATIVFISATDGLGATLFLLSAPVIAPFAIIPALKRTFHADEYDFTIQTPEDLQKIENDAKLRQELAK